MAHGGVSVQNQIKVIFVCQQCVLGRHVGESSGEKALIQKAIQSLLHGMRSLLDLGEGCVAEGPAGPVQNIRQLHVRLHRDQVLRLFHRILEM